MYILHLLQVTVMKVVWKFFTFLITVTSAHEDLLTAKQRHTLLYVRNIISRHFSSTDPIHVLFTKSERRPKESYRPLSYNPPTQNHYYLIDYIIKTISNELELTFLTESPIKSVMIKGQIDVTAVQFLLIVWPTSQNQNIGISEKIVQLFDHIRKNILTKMTTNPKFERFLILLTNISQKEMYIFKSYVINKLSKVLALNTVIVISNQNYNEE